MLGKIATMIIGRKLANRPGGMSPDAGAVLGAALPLVARRLGPAGMVAAAVGGYAVKKVLDKRRMRSGVVTPR